MCCNGTVALSLHHLHLRQCKAGHRQQLHSSEWMQEACNRYSNTHRHKWNSDDVADFISLSIYTGLRVSDVALFDVERMARAGEVRFRTTELGTHVYKAHSFVHNRAFLPWHPSSAPLQAKKCNA